MIFRFFVFRISNKQKKNIYMYFEEVDLFNDVLST